MRSLSPQPTPISTSTALDEDLDGEVVDQKEYRIMIDSLLYLTATQPDIQFGVGLCARYQASPLNLVFGTLRILLWFWWAFLMPISVGVGWIASRLRHLSIS